MQLWLRERNSSSTPHPGFSHCCHHGQVAPPLLPDSLSCNTFSHPETLRPTIFVAISDNTVLYFHLRLLTSLDVNSYGGGPWVFKAGYQLSHISGWLSTPANITPSYTQLYFYDPDECCEFTSREVLTCGLARWNFCSNPCTIAITMLNVSTCT